MRKICYAFAVTMLAAACVPTDAQNARQTPLRFGAGEKELPRVQAPARQAPARASAVTGPSEDDVLISDPAGTKYEYTRRGDTYGYNDLVGFYESLSHGAISNVVFSDGGKKIYIQHPITLGAGTTTYIEGTIEGDKAIFTFPQRIYHDEIWMDPETSVSFEYYGMLMEKEDIDEYPGFNFVPAETQTLTFTIGDGTLVPDNPERLLLGQVMWEKPEWADKEMWIWQGRGDIIESMRLFTDTYTPIPENVVMDAWYLTSQEPPREVLVGFDDNGDVYIKGLYAYIYGSEVDAESVMKGHVDGNEIHFPQNQFVGFYNTLLVRSGAYLTKGIPGEWDEESGEYVSFSQGEGDYVFSYDAESKVLTGQDYICWATLPDDFQYTEYMAAPVIKASNPNPVTAISTPELQQYLEPDGSWPGELYFTIPTMTEGQQKLNVNKLYYNVLVDGEPYVFTPEQYDGLEKATAELPYDTNIEDISYYGTMARVVLHMDFETLGVRAIYYEGGQPIYSDILQVVQAGISGIEAEAGATVKWYDLTGTEVAEPVQKGIYIRTTTYADGRRVSEKVSIR